MELFLHSLLPEGVGNAGFPLETDEEGFSASSHTPVRESTTYLPYDNAPMPMIRYDFFPAGYMTVLTPIFSPALSRNMLNQLIEVYNSNIHLQPLPLFDLEDLEQLSQMRARQYLVESFCALTILFSEHGNSLDQRMAFAREYADSARNVVNALALEASPRADVLQALCLLALFDMKRTWPAKTSTNYLH